MQLQERATGDVPRAEPNGDPGVPTRLTANWRPAPPPHGAATPFRSGEVSRERDRRYPADPCNASATRSDHTTRRTFAIISHPDAGKTTLTEKLLLAGGAIEMAGWLHIKVSLIKGGMKKYGVKNPIFRPSPITPKYDDYLIFEGISVDEAGKQHYLDVHIAYRQACLNAIEYLKKFGYSGAQAYSILGTAPVQGHISGVVDVPNACATLWLPTDIFEFDIMPGNDGPTKFLDGSIDMPIAQDL